MQEIGVKFEMLKGVWLGAEESKESVTYAQKSGFSLGHRSFLRAVECLQGICTWVQEILVEAPAFLFTLASGLQKLRLLLVTFEVCRRNTNAER